MIMTSPTSTTLLPWLTLTLLLASAWAPPLGPTPDPILTECVQSCLCYPQRHREAVVVECSNSVDLPPAFPQHTQLLRVSDSRIPALHTQLHNANLEKVHDLNLAGNGIREVAVDAFSRLKELRELDLSNNGIKWLSAEHFAHQRHLNRVVLVGNPGLDCAAFAVELRRASPAACVKCDGDDAPCVRTTRGPPVGRSPRPEVGPEPPEIGPNDPEIGPNHPDIGPNDPEIGPNVPEIGPSSPEIGPNASDIPQESGPNPSRVSPETAPDARTDADPSEADPPTPSLPEASSASLWYVLAALLGALVGGLAVAFALRRREAHILRRMFGPPSQGRDNDAITPLAPGEKEQPGRGPAASVGGEM